MHILVISENNSDLKWLDAPLTATGFTINVIHAYSMMDASSLMKSVRFDLVLYDLAFSEGCITSNFEELKANGPQVPLIVLTDNMGNPVAKDAIKYGASCHMVKDRMQLSAMAQSFKTILLGQNISYN